MDKWWGTGKELVNMFGLIYTNGIAWLREDVPPAFMSAKDVWESQASFFP